VREASAAAWNQALRLVCDTANLRPQEGDVVTGSDGTILTWTRYQSQRDWVNLEQVFGIHLRSVAYVYCELKADQAMETDLRGDCGNSTALWLNGQKVGQVPLIYWNHYYTDVLPVLPISLNAGRNSCLLKLRREQKEWSFSFQPLPATRSHAALHVTDLEGTNVAGAVVHFYNRGELAGRVTTYDSGDAEACIFPTAGVYDLHVISDSERMEQWVLDVAIAPGERRHLKVVLDDTVSISGRVLAMDGSPQNGIVVQAIRVPDSISSSGRATLRGALTSSAPSTKSRLQGLSPHQNNEIQSLLPLPFFSATTHTDTNGVYRFVNLQSGEYRLRCHGLYGYGYPESSQEQDASEPIVIEADGTPKVIDFRLPEIKKGVWRALPFTTTRPLSHESVYRTPDGMLWIGTTDYSFQAFDGIEFKTFALTDEPNDTVKLVAQSHVPRIRPARPRHNLPARFQSYFAFSLRRFLDLKRTLGRGFKAEGVILAHWDHFIHRRYPRARKVRGEMFAEWSKTLGHLSSTGSRNWQRVLRNFLLFHARDHAGTFIPDRLTFPKPAPSVSPRLISETEMGRVGSFV